MLEEILVNIPVWMNDGMADITVLESVAIRVRVRVPLHLPIRVGSSPITGTKPSLAEFSGDKLNCFK